MQPAADQGPTMLRPGCEGLAARLVTNPGPTNNVTCGSTPGRVSFSRLSSNFQILPPRAPARNKTIAGRNNDRIARGNRFAKLVPCNGGETTPANALRRRPRPA